MRKDQFLRLIGLILCACLLAALGRRRGRLRARAGLPGERGRARARASIEARPAGGPGAPLSEGEAWERPRAPADVPRATAGTASRPRRHEPASAWPEPAGPEPAELAHAKLAPDQPPPAKPAPGQHEPGAASPRRADAASPPLAARVSRDVAAYSAAAMAWALPWGWYQLGERQIRRNMKALSRLTRSRSPAEFAAIQGELVREGVEEMIRDGRTLAELSLRAAGQARAASPEDEGPRLG